MHTTSQITLHIKHYLFSSLPNPEKMLNMIKDICGLRQSQLVGSTLRMNDE